MRRSIGTNVTKGIKRNMLQGQLSVNCHLIHRDTSEEIIEDSSSSFVSILDAKRKRKRCSDHMADYYYNTLMKGSGTEEERDEFELYMNQPATSFTMDETPLQFWKRNENLYPHLALFARDSLGVPATGAGVERLFSESGKIDTPERNRILGKTMTAYMQVRHRYKREYMIAEDEDMQKHEVSDLEDDIEPELVKEWLANLRRNEELPGDEEDEEDEE